MRRFLCISFGFITYLSLNYFYGNSGLQALRILETYRKDLQESVKRLEQHQNLLEEELASLYYSEEDLKLQLRKLGYFQKNENVVYFSFPLPKNELNSQKYACVVLETEQLFSNSFFVIASFFSGLIVSMLYALMKDLVIWAKKNLRSKILWK